jgi:hypothetical protein
VKVQIVDIITEFQVLKNVIWLNNLKIFSEELDIKTIGIYNFLIYKRDDMGGIGSFSKECRSLYISDFRMVQGGIDPKA